VNRLALRTVALVALAALASGVASALPPQGAGVAEFRVENPDGVALTRERTAGRPLLVVYEDKDHGETNRAFKDELAKLAKGGAWVKRITLAAVADVQAYDFWPARGFVRSSIRDEEKKAGTPIYCDWSGAFRQAFQVKAGTSTVLVYGRDGKLALAYEGALTEAQRGEIMGALRREANAGEAESAAK
jgi:hypothetical protein